MLFFFAVFTPFLLAQSYNVLQPDISLAVDSQQLSQMVAKSDGFSWGGWYENNGDACKNPDVHLEIQAPRLLLRSWTSFVDGNGGISARISGTPKVFTNSQSCWGIGVPAKCEVQGCYASTIPGFALLNAKCDLFIREIFRGLIPVPSPVELISNIPLTVPKEPIKQKKGEISFELGNFVDDNWVPTFPANRKTLGIQPVVHGMGGKPLLRPCQPNEDPWGCDTDVCNISRTEPYTASRRLPKIIAFDGSLNPRKFVTFNTLDKAEQQFNSSAPIIKPSHFAGVRIGKRFLLGDDSSGGFFQKVLPIQVSGYQMAGKRKVDFRFYLTAANATFGIWQGKDAIAMGFVVFRPEAWLDSDPQHTVGIKEISVHSISTLPQPAPDPINPKSAVIQSSVVQFEIGFKVKIGTISVCFESRDLEKPLKTLYGSVARYVGPGALYPVCLNADPLVHPASSCPDGVTDGRISAEHPEKNVVITLDVSRAESWLDPSGDWMISVPLLASQ